MSEGGGPFLGRIWPKLPLPRVNPEVYTLGGKTICFPAKPLNGRNGAYIHSPNSCALIA